MSISTYWEIPKIRFALVRTGLGVETQELERAKPGAGHPGHPGRVRWGPVVLGSVVLYLFLSIARVWGPAWLVAAAPLALVGLTRTIYRAAALSLS